MSCAKTLAAANPMVQNQSGRGRRRTPCRCLRVSVEQPPHYTQQLEPIPGTIALLPAGIGVVIAIGRAAKKSASVNCFANTLQHQKTRRQWKRCPPDPDPDGNKRYALRKQIPEPVCGITKSARGLRRMHGAWGLITMNRNPKRIAALARANEHGSGSFESIRRFCNRYRGRNCNTPGADPKFTVSRHVPNLAA